MATAAIQIETEIHPIKTKSGKDPLMTRWGLNFVRDKFLDTESTGLASVIPFAKFFRIRTFEVPKPIHTVDDNPNKPFEELRTVTADSVELFLGEVLAGKTMAGTPDPNKDDWGGRFGFYGEESIAKMEVISAILMPKLSEFKAPCPSQDTYDRDRNTCPACWIEWVESPECAEMMADVALNGREVELTNTVDGSKRMELVKPTIEELENGRLMVIDSLRGFLRSADKTWSNIAKELKEGQRKGVDAWQNNLRKDIHADAPQDAELKGIREYAKAVSPNDNSALLERLAESQMQTNQLLSALVTQNMAIPTTEPITDPNKKGGKNANVS